MSWKLTHKPLNECSYEERTSIVTQNQNRLFDAAARRKADNPGRVIRRPAKQEKETIDGQQVQTDQAD